MNFSRKRIKIKMTPNPIKLKRTILRPSKTIMRCYLCDEKVNVAEGQVVYWHGKCRQEGRRKILKKHDVH